MEAEMATGSERILVIDDDRTALTYVKALLGSEGYDVFTAPDALQGPMMARRAQPDLVVLDLAMPGGGGTAVFERLRRLPGTARVPVVVYSSISRDRAEQMMPVGPDLVFVQKPGAPDEMLSAVRDLLARP
jgi:CheY-like chemotaxis protein